MSERMELSSEEFYENCIKIFWNVWELKLIKDQLNEYFEDLNFSVYEAWRISVSKKGEGIDGIKLLTSFNDFETFISQYLPGDLAVRDFMNSILSAVNGSVVKADELLSSICEVCRKETKAILRIERVEAIWEELIGKYGEDKIIYWEKLFSSLSNDFLIEVNKFSQDNYHSMQEFLYDIIKQDSKKIDFHKMSTERFFSHSSIITLIWRNQDLNGFLEKFISRLPEITR